MAFLSRRKMETSFAYGRNCVSSRLAKTGNNADDGFRCALLGLAAPFLAIVPLLDYLLPGSVLYASPDVYVTPESRPPPRFSINQ